MINPLEAQHIGELQAELQQKASDVADGADKLKQDSSQLPIYTQTYLTQIEPDSSLIVLNFATYNNLGTDACVTPVELLFDSDGEYVRQEHTSTLVQSCLIRLIKRASGRLALNSDNPLYANSKTELNTIGLMKRSTEGDWHLESVIRVDEVRQFNKTQQFKNALKNAGVGIASGAVALGTMGYKWGANLFSGAKSSSDNSGDTQTDPMSIMVGVATGAPAAGSEGPSGLRRLITGDDYLSSRDTELFTPETRLNLGGDMQVDVDVPFQIVIANLVFDKWAESEGASTLVIDGIFRHVKVGDRNQPAEVSNVEILNAHWFLNEDEQQNYVDQCNQNSNCLYFQPEI